MTDLVPRTDGVADFREGHGVSGLFIPQGQITAGAEGQSGLTGCRSTWLTTTTFAFIGLTLISPATAGSPCRASSTVAPVKPYRA
ncbi:hypothetical protein OUZ56_001530 [Daphnia magna]|uniref:Uncharacterized protein n=1 Tax=Daphnia magna TaxID=35525 RepID=A0ABR0A3F4_9CRUS|nr:hypothetical protein OUZ56_001530 [Daphnia magna]